MMVIQKILWRCRVSFLYLLILFNAFVTFVCVLVCYKCSYDLRYRIATIYSYFVILMSRFICGLRYKVIGIEKLPNVPCIVMSNHQSFWENMFMQLIIPKHSWVVKKELFLIPFWGWGFRFLDPVAIDRQDAMSVKYIVEKGIEKIKQGLWLIIFPESTRVRPGKNVKFKPSASKLAIEANVPVVLIAHNAGLVWPKSFWIQQSGLITVKIIEVLEPPFIQSQNVRELTDYLENRINTEKNNLAALDLV